MKPVNPRNPAYDSISICYPNYSYGIYTMDKFNSLTVNFHTLKQHLNVTSGNQLIMNSIVLASYVLLIMNYAT